VLQNIISRILAAWDWVYRSPNGARESQHPSSTPVFYLLIQIKKSIQVIKKKKMYILGNTPWSSPINRSEVVTI